MGGTGLWIAGLVLLGIGGALYFGVSEALTELVRSQLGAASGLLPAGLGILGCALCGLGFIQKSDV